MSRKPSRSKLEKGPGRSGRSNPFLLMPLDMLRSPAFDDLSYPAVKLLMLTARQYNGTNNGDLAITLNMLRAAGWNSSDTLWRARTQLVSHGFIRLTRQGGRHLPSLWAITWQPISPNKKFELNGSPAPSHAWKNWQK